MSILKPAFALIFGISVVGPAYAHSDIQCVNVSLKYNLVPDFECKAKHLISSKLPDLDFLIDDRDPFLKSLPSCFKLVNPTTLSDRVDGIITKPSSSDSVNIEVSGYAAFTISGHFRDDLLNAINPASYTGAACLKLYSSDRLVGKLYTRDAGTLYDFFPDPSMSAIAARISVAKGTKKLKKVTGYIDEEGMGIFPVGPAIAQGKLCGKNIFKKFANDEEEYDEDNEEDEEDDYED